jgi:hypothetical protein
MMDLATWVKALENDMMKIRMAKIWLPTFFKRLAEASEGAETNGWQRFRALGGGSSTQYLRDNNDTRERVIVMKFTLRTTAYDLFLTLKEVRDGIVKLEVIKGIEFQDAIHGEGGILVVSFPEPQR